MILKNILRASLFMLGIMGTMSLSPSHAQGTYIQAKFMPPEDKTLLIIGQYLGAIGGLADYKEGYVDSVQVVPAGLTTYTGIPSLGGLREKDNWGSGDVNAELLVNTPQFDNSALSIGLWVGAGDLKNVAAGTHDEAIDTLGNWIKEQKRPVFLRIGYEFDGIWNAYEPADYVAAFRHIVDRLRALEVNNAATVWQSATWFEGNYNQHGWMEWYPGDDYVDWFGMSYFIPAAEVFNNWLKLAREHGKPVMIAESTPKGKSTTSSEGDALWADWYQPFFDFIHNNADVIKAVAYINVNWDEQNMWKGQGWGDSRVQINPALLKHWHDEISNDLWLQSSAELFDALGYQSEETGAFYTGVYRNVLAEQGYSAEEIQARIDEVWQQLFYGNDETERIYYPVGDDMAYIIDVNNNDVRTEGMSYGMMIAVQLDKQEEFNRLWKWARTYMYQMEGAYKGYFSWHNMPDGTVIDANPASDGETWYVTALFLAANRWGNGEGIFDYATEANSILHTMLHKSEEGGIGTSMFHEETHMVVFVPRLGPMHGFTDPSYHTPHFYELWARWADADNDYWTEAAQISRDYWHTTAHPETGLMPDYSEFTGEPKISGDYGEFFYADAWRCAMNVALDYAWFAADEWQVEQSNRLLRFFYGLGIDSYNSKFTIDGQPADPQHRATGLIAMNAVAALAADDPIAGEFVKAFWDTPLTTGQYRYYDGLLYMLALLQLSGNFQVYAPG